MNGDFKQVRLLTLIDGDHTAVIVKLYPERLPTHIENSLDHDDEQREWKVLTSRQNLNDRK